jgi:hypothetical protein
MKEIPKKIIEDSAKKSLEDGAKATADAADKTVRLTSQLKQLKQELSQMELAGKANTAEYRKMAQQAGALEDQIGDTAARVKVLASDTKNLDAALSLATGVAGGFSVAQGAAALFGEENEDIQKALLKVQASLSILNGLQAIQATLNKDSAFSVVLLSGAQKAYNVVVGMSTGLVKALKIALAGLGIIGVIAGLVALIDKLDLFGKTTDDAAESQERLNKAMEEAQRREDEFAEVLSGTNRELERQYRLRKAQGADEAELYQLRRKIIQDEITSIDLALKTNSTIEKRLELDERRKDRLTDLAVLEAEYSRSVKNTGDVVSNTLREVYTEVEPITPIMAPDELETDVVEPSIKIVSDFYARLEELRQFDKQGALEILQEVRQANLDHYTQIEGYAQMSFDAISDISNQALTNRLTDLDEQLARGQITEEQYAKSAADAKTKEAKREKAIAFFRSLLSIPEAYLEGLVQGGPPLAFFYAGLAGIQSALIASAKIPQFATGTKRAPAGMKWVGEEGPELITDGGGYPIIPHEESMAIANAFEKWGVSYDYEGNAIVMGGSDIDYNKLAKALAKEISVLPITETHFDENGFTRAVRAGANKVTYLDNRYSSQ